MSWKVEVKATGDKDWVGNSMRFETSDEANAYGRDLYARWTMMQTFRVEQSDDPVNYRWENGWAKEVRR